MSFSTITDPQYVDSGHQSVRFVTNIDGIAGTVLYVAANGDPTSQALYNALVAGTYGPVAGYVAVQVPLSNLTAIMMAAVSATANAIVAQIMPDATRQAAFLAAASIVNGNGNAAPSSGPLEASFNAMAASYGLSPASLAATILAAQVAALSLEAARATCAAAGVVATDPAGLSYALDAFETARGNVVTAINEVLTVPIVNPPAIVVYGIA